MNYRVVYQESFDRAMNRVIDDKTFFQYFYQVFTESRKIISQKFCCTDTDTLALAVKDSFRLMVGFFDGLIDSGRLQYVAYIRSPKKHDIHPDLFKYWIESLLQTVRAFDPCYTK